MVDLNKDKDAASAEQSGFNPYSPPESSLNGNISPVQGGGNQGNFIPGGRKVSIGNGANWLGSGWKMFKQNPGMWMLAFFLMSLIVGVIFIIPFINIIGCLFVFVFAAGMVSIAHHKHTTGEFDFGRLFDGFKNQMGPLILLALVVSAFTLVAVILILLIQLIFGGGLAALSYSARIDDPSALLAGGLVSILLTFIVYIATIFVIMALTTFAPHLLLIRNLPLGQALSMSFSGFTKNILPGIIYAILFSIISSVAIWVPGIIGITMLFSQNGGLALIFFLITAILGLAIYAWNVSVLYAAFRDIFFDDSVQGSNTTTNLVE